MPSTNSAATISMISALGGYAAGPLGPRSLLGGIPASRRSLMRGRLTERFASDPHAAQLERVRIEREHVGPCTGRESPAVGRADRRRGIARGVADRGRGRNTERDDAPDR